MFSFLLHKQSFFLVIGEFIFGSLTINCGVSRGSILAGILLFLLNDISQALSDSHTNLYADNTSIFYQHKDVAEIEKVLKKEFANMCECFKPSFHFGEDLNAFFTVRKNTCRSLT